MEKLVRPPYEAAIDPLALLFPSDVYIKIVEMLHPHVPLIAVVEEVVKSLPVEEKKAVINRAKRLIEYGDAVQKVVAKTM
ncbi:MAG TPA: hypothetical protein VH186_24595 [Chloroflexia bacterium]|nr:hypothetical protein [Chloroflexia bacterium]